jgi:hypothetical protein
MRFYFMKTSRTLKTETPHHVPNRRAAIPLIPVSMNLWIHCGPGHIRAMSTQMQVAPACAITRRGCRTGKSGGPVAEGIEGILEKELW